MDKQKLKDFLAEVKNKDQVRNIYIWGIGYYGKLLGQLFNMEGVQWKAYYDNYDDASKRHLNGKEILSGIQIDTSRKAMYYISMKGNIADIVKSQLLLEGVCDKNIFMLKEINVFAELESLMLNDNGFDLNRIKKYNNIHESETCFIVGNGPSLKVEDLESVQKNGYITFASNYIFKCYNHTSWRPNYYVVFDTNAVRRILMDRNIAEIISPDCDAIFSYNYADENSIKIDNLVTCNYICSNENLLFSSDCGKQLYSGKSVSFAMLQLAVYMGFSKIYLIGMDHSFSTEIKSNGEITHKKIQDHSKALDCGNVSYFYIDDVTRAYMKAKEYADEHGIKIFNATRGGALEVFERVDIDSLI